MFKSYKYLNSLRGFQSSLQKVSKFNFARNLNKFVPIYPGDKVVVLPPWGTTQLNSFARKRLKLNQPEEAKIQYGTVLEVRRKKGQAVVSRVNEKPKYVSPGQYLRDYEFGNINKIKSKMVNLPIDINRVKLRDTSVKDKLRILQLKLVKNEDGKLIRINKETNEEIKNPLSSRDTSYAKRAFGRKDGLKDTSAALRSIKTYQGEDFAQIARIFIRKIKSKEEIERKLILKDK